MLYTAVFAPNLYPKHVILPAHVVGISSYAHFIMTNRAGAPKFAASNFDHLLQFHSFHSETILKIQKYSSFIRGIIPEQGIQCLFPLPCCCHGGQAFVVFL
jgi:hypothetical protein